MYIGVYLLPLTFAVVWSQCPVTSSPHDTRHNVAVPPIGGICGNQQNDCSGSQDDVTPTVPFDRQMEWRLRQKAKRMDKSFKMLYQQFRTPRQTCPCLPSCIERVHTENHIHGTENITHQQIRATLMADLVTLEKVLGTLVLMPDGSSFYPETLRYHFRLAKNMAKQLMCDIGLALPSVGGARPCGPVTPVIASWCDTHNEYDWNDRNFIIMGMLTRVSHNMRRTYHQLTQSSYVL